MASACLRKTMSNPCVANFVEPISEAPDCPECATDYPRYTSRFGPEKRGAPDRVRRVARGSTANMSISAKCLRVAFNAIFFRPIPVSEECRRHAFVANSPDVAEDVQCNVISPPRGPVDALEFLKWTPFDPTASAGWPP
jgi:hypothetical protein